MRLNVGMKVKKGISKSYSKNNKFDEYKNV